MIDNSFAGSMDSGATDMEYSPIMYPPKSTRIICASDEQHDALERRIAALELQVHRLINSEPHPPEADYAHIPAAEWEAICAELEAMRAWKASVPWKSIERLLNDARNEGSFLVGDYVAARQWLDANAPKDAAK